MTFKSYTYTIHGYVVECDGPGLHWCDEFGVAANDPEHMTVLIEERMAHEWDADAARVAVENELLIDEL